MKNIFCAAKAIIQNDEGQFLVLKIKVKNVEFWDIPGGKLEYGENCEDALIRELKEELDVKIDIIKILGTWKFIRILDQDQVVCITYLCKLRNKKVNIKKNPSGTENNIFMKWVNK